MNATNWQTLWPIQSESSANWRMLTPRRVTQNDRQLKIYLKLGDFFQLSISKCTANVSTPRQDHFNLFHTLIWYSIHKILSQRPSVGAKYSSVWLYLLNSTLPKPVFPGDDGQQHLWCSGAPHQTWKGHHLFSILHLLLHHSTVVYIGLNAPYGLYLHAFMCWRICKLSQNYIIPLQSVKLIRFLFYLTEWASWWLMLQHSHACASSCVLYRSL